ncbi:MAG: NDP-sugar synthase, partial [Clostridia bacterium]
MFSPTMWQARSEASAKTEGKSIMSLQAIIMAGGEGARLRPLTCDLPKPLVPVLGQPVMRYALQLLRRHGLTNIGATLQYLPSAMIRAFGDGREDRVSLRYFREEKPAGTAGSIKLAASALHHTFFVLSGDGLTDCDLQAALRFHKQRGALATLVLKRVPCPLPYGVVVTDETGRITRFIEKPGWDEACSDTVNTGIYILEPEVLARIPADQPYDFGSQLFPLLVSERQPVYGYVMNGYWCDIGDISAYLQAQIDFLHGRVRLESDAQPDAQGIWMAGDARIAEDARLIGPCYVGNNVQIDPGAIIGEDSVLCDGVHIGAQASVKRTVLWQDAFVGEGAQVRAAILCRNARMEARSQAFEDAVLGDYAQLGM